MRVDINSKIFVESDNLEYAVYEKSTIKTGAKAGEVTKKDIGHFTKMPCLLDFLVNRTPKTSKAVNDFAQLNKEVEQAKKEIRNELKALSQMEQIKKEAENSNEELTESED